jgi:ABC-2 type transport system permease protein
MKKYWALFTTQVLNTLAYPGEIIWRSLAILLFLWVFTFLWRVAYSNTDQQILAGLTFRDTLWYLLMAEAIELSRPRFAVKIAQSVKDGSIAYILTKPYDFLLYQMSVNAGDTLLRIILTSLFGSMLVVVMVGSPPGLLGWSLAIIAATAGWFINFLITSLIGLAAFVTEEVTPFMWIYQKFIFILGGMMIPLDFYPDWLQNISKASPFAYIMYGPARIFVSPDFNKFSILLLGQFGWIIGLGIVVVIAYHMGLRRLVINGG